MKRTPHPAPAEVTALFLRHLNEQSRRDDVRYLAAFGNSFEGWLKWELALAAVREWGCRPWKNQTETAKWGTVGVEFTEQLRTRTAHREKKQIDLWVYPRRGKRYVYVELKVVFKNANRHKQFASARDDLTCLHAIGDRKYLAGCVVLVVAVGFTRAELQAEAEGGAVHWIADRRGKESDETPSVAVISFEN